MKTGYCRCWGSSTAAVPAAWMCANKLHKTHLCQATTFIVVQQKQHASYLK